MNVKYRVDLGQGEREELTAWSSAGKIAARRLKRKRCAEPTLRLGAL